jgi:hypothetical protein
MPINLKKNQNIICVGIVVGVGVLLIILGSYLAHSANTATLPSEWQSTMANVTAAPCNQTYSNPNPQFDASYSELYTTCLIEYAYVVDGKSFMGSETTASSYSGLITIYFKQNQPQISTLTSPNSRRNYDGAVGYAMLAIGALMVLSTMAYAIDRKLHPRAPVHTDLPPTATLPHDSSAVEMDQRGPGIKQAHQKLSFRESFFINN